MFEVAGINIGPVDLVVIVVMLISFIVGLIKGFVWVLSIIVILAGGLLAGNHFKGNVLPYVRKLSDKIVPPYDTYLSYFFIFVAVAVVVSLIAYLLRKILKTLRLRSYDRFLGGVLGLVMCAVVIVIVMCGTICIWPQEDVKNFIQNSYSARYAAEMVRKIGVLFPEEMRNEVGKIIRILESEREREKKEGKIQERKKGFGEKKSPKNWDENWEEKVNTEQEY